MYEVWQKLTFTHSILNMKLCSYSMKTCRHLVHRCTDNYDPELQYVLSPPPESLFFFSSTHSSRSHILVLFASHINYITFLLYGLHFFFSTNVELSSLTALPLFIWNKWPLYWYLAVIRVFETYLNWRCLHKTHSQLLQLLSESWRCPHTFAHQQRPFNTNQHWYRAKELSSSFCRKISIINAELFHRNTQADAIHRLSCLLWAS